MTFKRSIAFNGFWPEFAQDKKLGYGDSLINIQAVFDKGKETEWGLNTHHVFHKGDVLNLEIIVMGNFAAASLWEGFFRVRMSSDDNRSIKTAPVYIRSSPVQAEVHELDQYKKR